MGDTIEVEDIDVRTGEAFVFEGLDTLNFRLERETKGAVKFQELDEADEPIRDLRDAVVGVLYLRKEPWNTLGRPYDIIVQVGVKR